MKLEREDEELVERTDAKLQHFVQGFPDTGDFPVLKDDDDAEAGQREDNSDSEENWDE